VAEGLELGAVEVDNTGARARSRVLELQAVEVSTEALELGWGNKEGMRIR
jgi:hypothetical protein